MNIAIFSTANSESGGAFQYQLNLIDILKGYKKHKLIIIASDKKIAQASKGSFKVLNLSWILNKIRFLKKKSEENYTIENVNPNEITKEALKKKWEEIKKNNKQSLPDKLIHKIIEKYLKLKKVDLILWPSPQSSSFKINIPYIFTVYDLEHRRIPQFPELSAFGEYERRESLYENGLRNAVAIITDSVQGKKDIVSYYQTKKEKIFPIKYLPSDYLEENIPKEVMKNITKKYDLPKEYIYYPAQFWPHKNHILILKAISFLRKQGIEIHAVFSGYDKKNWGMLEKLKQDAIILNISDLIHYVGYVSNEEISTLYKKSKALVMASQLGPSNIPYIEAFKLGVPVIAMDVPGIKDQVQDAAIIVNPNKEKELARAIQRILTDTHQVKKMITNGKRVLDGWTKDNFKRALFEVIDYSFGSM